MSNNLSKQKGGTPLNPSERDSGASTPQRKQDQQKSEPREGEYRNVETAVNNPSYFNDDYETEQEAQISREEARTKNENDTPGKRRADQA